MEKTIHSLSLVYCYAVRFPMLFYTDISHMSRCKWPAAVPRFLNTPIKLNTNKMTTFELTTPDFSSSNLYCLFLLRALGSGTLSNLGQQRGTANILHFN